jgi:integrase/recombinase XerC
MTANHAESPSHYHSPNKAFDIVRTSLTTSFRSGADVVLVAEIAGHRRLDTTRRYSLPSQADKDAALEAVLVET